MDYSSSLIRVGVTLKKTMTVLAFTAGIGLSSISQANPVLLLGFDSWNAPGTSMVNVSSTNATGVSGSLTLGGPSGEWDRVSKGSGDGTFGTTLTGASQATTTAAGSLETKGSNVGGNTITITINNNRAGYDLVLDEFLFDYWKVKSGGPQPTITFSGDIVGDPLLSTELTYVDHDKALPSGSNASSYDGQDVDLADHLTDNIIENGESATIVMTLVDTGPNNVTQTYFDNFAISGTLLQDATVMFIR